MEHAIDARPDEGGAQGRSFRSAIPRIVDAWSERAATADLDAERAYVHAVLERVARALEAGDDAPPPSIVSQMREALLESCRELPPSACRRVHRALDRALLEEGASAAREHGAELLSVVSHELRNPLGVILGWSQIARMHERLDHETARALDVIERHARVQLRLVEDLLDAGRAATGRLVVSPERCDLGAIVASAVDSMRPNALTHGITIAVESADGIACDVDPERFQQVLWNVVQNALKFTPRGGTITVALTAQGERALLRVSDSGCGIPRDALSRVFERFWQIDPGTRRRDGLGLGLSLVRHIVELHGGKVWAESEGDGRGASIAIELPRACEGSRAAHDDTDGALRGRAP